MVAATTPLPSDEITVTYWPRGGAADLLRCRDREALLDGPAGTGKTLCALWKLHLAALNHPGMRGLMLRKVFEDLKGSAMVTFRERVLGSHPQQFGVEFFGGSKERDAGYYYPNGSFLGVGGLDRPTKIMSKEYDLVYINEATEVAELDWENITTRLRFGRMPYQQVIADCNPDAPTHWLNQRCDQRKTTRLLSRHEDNPSLYDADVGAWTPFGVEYIGRLDALSGVRRDRLRVGKWVAAEGQVYEGWDAAVHLIDRFPIPDAWPRYRATDFGFVHPFVTQWWAEDPDGRLYRYREIYRTGRLVEDHCREIAILSAGEPRPRADITDHDAEDRATYEKHLGVRTTAAKKDVSPGIQVVASRLKSAGDGRPRLFFLRDSLVERDPDLSDQRLPACTEEEFGVYIWDTGGGRKRGEDPVKRHDHGMDATRYLVAFKDPVKRRATAWSASWA